MKNFFVMHRGKLIIAVLIIALLLMAFLWGGRYPKAKTGNEGLLIDSPEPTFITAEVVTEVLQATENPTRSPEETPDAAASPTKKNNDESDTTAETIPTTVQSPAETELPLETGNSITQVSPKPGPEGSSEGVYTGSKEYSERLGMKLDEKSGKDKYKTDPVPEGKPLPVEPQEAVITETEYKCILSVSCGTILDNMDLLEKAKWELVPEDGIIFPATEVIFYEGESVFNVLLREMKKAKIHMEFENTPIYNSAYIEGINNLYEFDVGELSGWMYSVNDWFPNYGCSRYKLIDGDVVNWVYTCDLGRDVGGYYAVGSE
jgi:hypothetical protein